MKKNQRKFRAVSFVFDEIAPGATATVERTEELALRPDRVLVNPRDYDKGADFAGFEAGGLPYPVPPMTSNRIPLHGDVVPPKVPICLTLRNNGERPVHPVAVVFMEVVEDYIVGSVDIPNDGGDW